ncbi:S-adenosylmethionine sensor upstream of mTORC1 [Hyalella azteca]|uniref:S-adenosylmethionine sensor upstream of mTORC1 n=1 Tax=Hyalella azteca TaxID=294128 RepID=A0A8B7P7Y1_HYAAZ|nr:S-adenosylmethionine sensor upstream of mTORC1 [Hyalella azteca]
MLKLIKISNAWTKPSRGVLFFSKCSENPDTSVISCSASPEELSLALKGKSLRDLAFVLRDTHRKLKMEWLQDKAFDEIWSRHTSDTSLLTDYAAAMLAIRRHWELNKESSPERRNIWLWRILNKYFMEGENVKALEDEVRLATRHMSDMTTSQEELEELTQRIKTTLRPIIKSQLNSQDSSCSSEMLAKMINSELQFIKEDLDVDTSRGNSFFNAIGGTGNFWSRRFSETDRVRVLDVGSCYNPLGRHPKLLVTPIDLMPATKDVYKCDFLQLEVADPSDCDIPPELASSEDPSSDCDSTPTIERLPCESFDAVVFSLMLDYIPCPEARLECCRKASELLKPGGLLLIVTPSCSAGMLNPLLFKYFHWHLAKLGLKKHVSKKTSGFRTFSYRKAFYPFVAEAGADKIQEDAAEYRDILKRLNYTNNIDKVDLTKGLYFYRDIEPHWE